MADSQFPPDDENSQHVDNDDDALGGNNPFASGDAPQRDQPADRDNDALGGNNPFEALGNQGSASNADSGRGGDSSGTGIPGLGNLNVPSARNVGPSSPLGGGGGGHSGGIPGLGNVPSPRKAGPSSPLTPGQIGNAEKGATPSLGGAAKAAGAAEAGGALGGFYNSAPVAATTGFFNSLTNYFNNSDNRKKTGIAGGIIGAVMLIAAGGLASLPNHLITEMKSIEQRVNVYAESATEKEMDKLFENYLKKHVLPSLGKGCTSTNVSKSCVAAIHGTDPISRMYDSWRQGNLENRLAQKYNIVFGKDSSGRIYMAAPGLPTNGVDLKDFVDGKASIFDLPAIKQTRALEAMRDALKDETLWTRTMYRFRQAKLLHAKYGLVQCVIACNAQAKVTDSIAAAKLAAKSYLIRRIVEPQSSTLALALQCMMSNSCDANKLNKNDGSVSADADPTGGEEVSDFDKNVEQAMADYAAKFGSDKLDDLVKEVARVRELGGVKNYLAQKALEKVAAALGVDVSTDAVTKALPVVGTILATSKIVAFLSNASPELKHIVNKKNMQAAVQLYGMYRSVADEQKAGSNGANKADATTIGSFNDSLGAGTQDDGGGVPATSTPLYSYLFDNGADSPTSALLDSSGNTTAYADSTSSFAAHKSPFTCQDGNQVPYGTLVCPENNIHWSGDYLTQLSDTFNGDPGMKYVADLASLINKINPSGLLGPITDLLSKMPGVKDINDLMAKAIMPLMNVLENLLPSNVNPNMDGGQISDTVIQGGFIAASDYTQHSLGGVQLTDKQAAEISTEQLQEQQKEFDSKPMLARIFDKEDPNSLVSHIAMAIPTNITSALQSGFASIISDPIGKFTNSIASVFSANKAHAVTAPSTIPGDPFGKPVGYPTNDPVFTDDNYWDDHNCAAQKAKDYQDWNNAAVQDPDTGEAINTQGGSGTNGCALIDNTTDAGGQWFGDTGSGGGS